MPEYELYADIWFLTNFAMDGIALWAGGKFLRQPVILRRVLLGSLAGTGASMFLFFQMHDYALYQSAVHFLVNPFMIWLCYHREKRKPQEKSFYRQEKNGPRKESFYRQEKNGSQEESLCFQGRSELQEKSFYRQEKNGPQEKLFYRQEKNGPQEKSFYRQEKYGSQEESFCHQEKYASGEKSFFHSRKWLPRLKAFFCQWAALYLSVFLLGGFLEWALPKGTGSLHVLLCLAGAVAAVEGMEWLILHIRKEKETVYDLLLLTRQGRIPARGFYDTGNLLADPMLGRPVHIARKSLLWDQIEREALPLRLIPYHSLGQESGMIEAVTLEGMYILQEERPVYLDKPVFGIADEKLFQDDRCDVILNGKSMEH